MYYRLNVAKGARVKTVLRFLNVARGDSRLFFLPSPLSYFYLYNIRGGRGTNEPVQSWMIGLCTGSNFYSQATLKEKKYSGWQW